MNYEAKFRTIVNTIPRASYAYDVLFDAEQAADAAADAYSSLVAAKLTPSWYAFAYRAVQFHEKYSAARDDLIAAGYREALT